MMDRFEQWELSADMKSSKIKKASNTTNKKDEHFGCGIAAQIGLKKKKGEIPPKRILPKQQQNHENLLNMNKSNLKKTVIAQKKDNIPQKKFSQNISRLKAPHIPKLQQHSNNPQPSHDELKNKKNVKRSQSDQSNKLKTSIEMRSKVDNVKGCVLTEVGVPVATSKRFDHVVSWINQHSELDILAEQESVVPSLPLTSKLAQDVVRNTKHATDKLNSVVKPPANIETLTSSKNKQKLINDLQASSKKKRLHSDDKESGGFSSNFSSKHLSENTPHIPKKKKFQNGGHIIENNNLRQLSKRDPEKDQLLSNFIQEQTKNYLKRDVQKIEISDDDEMKDLFGTESKSNSDQYFENGVIKKELISPKKNEKIYTNFQDECSDVKTENDKPIVKCEKPTVKCEMPEKSKTKKIRPVSFATEIVKVNASCQTDTNKDNIKQFLHELEESEKPKPVKYKIDIEHDQFAYHTESPLYDAKGNDITELIKQTVSKYKAKYKKSDTENCFITLDSRFQIMNTSNIKLLEVLPEQMDDTKVHEVEAIRVFNCISKEYYSVFLPQPYHDNIPELIITRIFPTAKKML